MLRNTITFSFLLFFTFQNGFSQCASTSNIYSYSYDGKTYEIVKELKTWTNAASCAVERGGHLVEVNSQAEQDELFSQLMNNSGIVWPSTISWFAWIGGSDSGTEGMWIWDGDNNGTGTQFWDGGLTGSPVGGAYNNWGDEPDNAGNQDALAIALNDWPFGVEGEWNDIGVASSYYFVIEIPSSCMNTFDSIAPSSCDVYISPSGIILGSSSMFNDTIPNSEGCDSIITIDLTINNTNSFNVVDTICELDYLSPTGKIWNTSGLYKDTIDNVGGCDSIIDFDLTFSSINVNTNVNNVTIESESTAGEYQWLDCDNNYDPISGENAQSYTPVTNGEYAVEITVNGCSDTSACVSINGIGIEELGALVNVYQSHEQLIFSFGQSNSNSISIFDIQGRLMINQSDIHSESFTLEHALEKGTYILKVHTSQVEKEFKLIIQY